jgi:CMP-N,N'-diacetyllegionaminic acid synthase
MIRRVCTLCARGGSKGIPNKNIRGLMGRPLIAHSIQQAKDSNLFEVIAVSSDSPAILDAAKEAGANFLVRRPDDMASDTAAKVPAIRHCLLEAERLAGHAFDLLVDLDATSPLRALDDIHGAVKLLESSGASNVITGAVARRSPYFNLVELSVEGFVALSKPLGTRVVRRQDAPRCFDMNASIYAWRRDVFVKEPAVFYADTRLFQMPEERSHDIDSELDFEWVEYLMRRRSQA